MKAVAFHLALSEMLAPFCWAAARGIRQLDVHAMRTSRAKRHGKDGRASIAQEYVWDVSLLNLEVAKADHAVL